jgi:hypothetical protein
MSPTTAIRKVFVLLKSVAGDPTDDELGKLELLIVRPCAGENNSIKLAELKIKELTTNMKNKIYFKTKKR